MDADTRLAETPDPFWQEELAKHIASRGRHADPSACGTCREHVAAGRHAEHDECVQRALIVQPPDMPDWELLIEMTEQEKKDLPARFHVPIFEDSASPKAWLCAVCWGEGWVSSWPCATACKHGAEVFTPNHHVENEQAAAQRKAAERDAEIAELRIKLEIAERQTVELDERLTERTRQLNGLLDSLSFDEKAVPA